MSDGNIKLKQAGIYVDSKDVDVSHAQFDTSLSKVWSDDATGEISVPVERIFFDSLLDVSARFLEPHGYSLNLENILSTIDSMRFAITAVVSSKQSSDGRPLAKKLMPSLYMHLPKKKSVGPLLQRFYNEIEKYESALARLQESEARSKKTADASIRDESGKKTLEMLRQDNDALKDEIIKLSKKLAMAEDAIRAVPNASFDNQLPTGVRSAVVRSVRISEGSVQLKANDSQFSVSLKTLGGIPKQNARALCFYESGILKSIWAFDPVLEPFENRIAEVMAVDGKKVKLRFTDRKEILVILNDFQTIPTIGSRLLAKFAKNHLVDFSQVNTADTSKIGDYIFDQQTQMTIGEFKGGSDD